MNIIIRKVNILTSYLGKKTTEYFFKSNHKSLIPESNVQPTRVIFNKVKIQSKVFSNRPISKTIHYSSTNKHYSLRFKKSYGINAYSDKGSLSFNTLNKYIK